MRFSALPNDTVHGTARLPHATIDEAIVRILRNNSPAVLSFPWESGLKNSASLRSMYNLFIHTSADAFPLTGFDNGNIIYHHSLMPFLLPFAPYHEGMWHGEWTLPATWLQLFLPHMYRSNNDCSKSRVHKPCKFGCTRTGARVHRRNHGTGNP